MPQTPCRAFGCPALVSRKDKGYCDAHASKRYGWGRAEARTPGSTHRRGYGHAWRKLRAQVLERDGYTCKVCERLGRITPANEVDHKRNKASGGDDTLLNLQAICARCHTAKTQAEAKK